MPDAIPAERVPHGGWVREVTCGIVGGFTPNSTVYDDNGDGVTESLEAIANDDSEDVYAAIQAAIDACPSGEDVVLPDGIFRTDSGISLPTTFSGKGFRSKNGSEFTTIKSRANVGLLAGSASGYYYPTIPLRLTPAELTKGTDTVTITGESSDIALLTVGRMIRLLFTNRKATTPLCYSIYLYNEKTNSSPSNQLVRVVSVVGDQLEFTPPLAFDQTQGPARIAFQQFQAENISIQGITMDMTEATAGGGAYVGISCNQIYGLYLRDITTIKSLNYGTAIIDCLHSELHDSWAGQLKGSGSNGSGLLFSSTCNSIVENCAFVAAFPGIEVNFASTQNVFGYCFTNGQANTNHGPNNDGNLYIHGAFNHTLSDGYFGSQNRCTFYGCFAYAVGINLRRFDRETTVNDCVLSGAIGCGLPFFSAGTWSGEAQLSLGDTWRDDEMTGEVIEVISPTSMRVQITSGGKLRFSEIDLHRAAFYYGDDLELVVFGDVTAWDEEDSIATLDTFSTPPIVGTIFGEIGAGSYGGAGVADDGSYCELDLDVEEFLIERGNYNVALDETSTLDGNTLTNPFYSAKPSFADVSDPFPPYSGTGDPNGAAIGNIPAGRRYEAFIPDEAPAITTDPSIVNSPVIGNALLGVAGTVTGNPLPTNTWKWQVDDGGGYDYIPGATSISYPNTEYDYIGMLVRLEQTATNGVGSPAVAYSAPVTITPFMGDVITLNQTANTDPVIELVRRGPVGGPYVDTKVNHSGPYPQVPPNGFVHKPVRGNGDHTLVWVDPASDYSLIELQAARNVLDPL